MRLNPKMTKPMIVSRPRTYAPGYDDFTLGDTELEEVNGLCILGVTLDSKLSFEMHLRKVMSKTAWSLSAVCRAGELFDCPRVLRNCFNAYVMSNLECLVLSPV